MREVIYEMSTKMEATYLIGLEGPFLYATLIRG